jgi:protein SCO1/2
VPRGPSPSATQLARIAWIGLPLAAAALVVALTSRQAPGARRAPPRLAVLPEFSLADAAGRPVTLAGLHGRPWVADFIFTRCAGVCPAMSARMARLRREVDGGVDFVSFTVDPAHDTPEVLARYAARFGADAGWRFVTGPASDLYSLSVGGFKLAAEAVTPEAQAAGGDGPFLHSGKFVLVDGRGVVRGYYDSADEQAVRALREDAALVLAEAP